MKHVLKSLPESNLMPLRLTAAVSAPNVTIKKEIIGYGNINCFKWRNEWSHENG